MHSRSPKVVVLGIEQRFCQQCSKFHVASEFDDSKRSCRRLAGHNERRRKSSNDTVTRNPSKARKSRIIYVHENESQQVYPRILGHEAIGLVESIGEGGLVMVEGDHVIPIYRRWRVCQNCVYCKSEKINLCERFRLCKIRSRASWLASANQDSSIFSTSIDPLSVSTQSLTRPVL